MSDDQDEALAREWYDLKSALMEELLGAEHEQVMHSIIPFSVGGGLDLYYYYPKGWIGTAIATKELSEEIGNESTNDVFNRYELVMFTKELLDLDSVRDLKSAFGNAHSRINEVLNGIARYSRLAKLNPYETCEFPIENTPLDGCCLIFDGYPDWSPDEVGDFGLLAIIEVFRSEMEFARSRKAAALIERLKDAGHYPYSDLNRRPVA